MLKKIKPYIALIPISVCALITAVAALLYNPGVFALMLCLVSLSIIGAVIWLFFSERKLQKEIDNIFTENTAVAREIILNLSIPCLFCSGKSGNVTWSNAEFNRITTGVSVKRFFSQTELGSNVSVEKVIGGRTYRAHISPVVRANERSTDMYFIYLADITDLNTYKRLYSENFPVVALIYIDNYEDINSAKDITHSRSVINDIEKLVADMARSVNGIYVSPEGARFVMIFESKNLQQLIERHFDILDAAREIHTESGQCVTLSIGVGVESATASAYSEAQNAMEIALGRGGDQVAVKDRDTNYRFFGGKTTSTTKVSRVRVRSVASSLRALMENATDVFIMGHRNADMDCVGAAFGLLRCAFTVNAAMKAYYVIENGLETVEPLLNTKLPKHFADAIITPTTALELIKNTSLLIVVDTQRENLLCSVDLYRAAETANTVVIDHHRRSTDAITDTQLSYLEPAASSTSELITEIIQCICEGKLNMPVEANALLSGICLDTKFFVFNTGTRTFEAAGYLRKCGADPGAVKRLFQDDMDTYAKRAQIVESATILPGGIAIATCVEAADTQILAAQAADALITIRGIGAAFVLAQMGASVSVSARSLGIINVQRVCEKLGGGGHLAVAGAQLRDVTIAEAITRLKACIDEYLKEDAKI